MSIELTFTTQPASNISFKNFVFRKYCFIVLFVTVLLIAQFIIYKLLYPFANFIPDSYGYIEAAQNNLAIHVWPIGYAKFLWLFHEITSSDTILVLFQYILLETATLCFIFTLLYLLKPGKAVSYIVLILSPLNPILLSISNYVSSDALFASLSLLWIVQLLWLLYNPKSYHIWTHGIVLFLAFTVRYNALYYPIIGITVILFSRISYSQKLLGVGFVIFLVGIFIWHNCNKYKDVVGIRQFSGFSGWQLASNALFMYSRIAENNDSPPPQFYDLHQFTRIHIDSLRQIKIRPDAALGIYYLWNNKAPLQRYMEQKWGIGINSAIYFKEWASMSKLYGSYGLYLIKKHPIPYTRYFVWPNTINYFIPSPEFLEYYNVEGDNVRPLAQSWFKYKTTNIRGFTKQISIFKLYPILLALLNTFLVYSAITFLFVNKPNQILLPYYKTFSLLISIWLANLGFSILSSPIVLRYQIFPMILYLPYEIILFEFLLKKNTPKP